MKKKLPVLLGWALVLLALPDLLTGSRDRGSLASLGLITGVLRDATLRNLGLGSSRSQFAW